MVDAETRRTMEDPRVRQLTRLGTVVQNVKGVWKEGNKGL